MGEDSQWATSEMERRKRSGIESTSIPLCLHKHLKAKMGTPRSALVLGKSSKMDQRRERNEKERHAAYVSCLQQGHFTKIGLITDQKECESAPRPTARGGGGGKPSWQLLCLTIGSGFRAEVRMLLIPTAVVCLQDLRNWTKQLKRNPVA